MTADIGKNSEWFCWIGPYNAHCFRNDKGEPMQPDGSCYFCGAPDPESKPDIDREASA